MNHPEQDLRAWIGRSETLHDTIDAKPVLALGATLDHPATPVEAGMPLPPLWHWLYFLPMHRQSAIGADGHAKRGTRPWSGTWIPASVTRILQSTTR